MLALFTRSTWDKCSFDATWYICWSSCCSLSENVSDAFYVITFKTSVNRSICIFTSLQSRSRRARARADSLVVFAFKPNKHFISNLVAIRWRCTKRLRNIEIKSLGVVRWMTGFASPLFLFFCATNLFARSLMVIPVRGLAFRRAVPHCVASFAAPQFGCALVATSTAFRQLAFDDPPVLPPLTVGV